MRASTVRIIVTPLLLWGSSAPRCYGGVIDYLLNYRLGFEIAKDVGSLTATYDTTSDVPLNVKKCNSGDQGAFRCQDTVGVDGSYAPGLTLEQPFERHGLLHFDYDFDFAFRRFKSDTTRFDEVSDLPPAGQASPPLRKMAVELYGIKSDAYLEFGLTPKSPVPNLLFDLGVGLQPLYGFVEFNNRKSKLFLLTSLYYGEIDLVLHRFGKAGAITLYALGESASANLGAMQVDGMRQFQLLMVKKSFGLTILTDFP